MSNNGDTDDDISFRPVPRPTEPETNNQKDEQPSIEAKPLSIDPVTLQSIILNIYIKFEKDGHVENLVVELMQPNKHLPLGPYGQHPSTLHQYALVATSDPIDMSTQTERLTYQPNLFIKRNDAHGPWSFNYLLTLLSLDYQHDGENFPPVWKTNSTTKVQINIIREYQDNNTTTDSNSTKSSRKKDDITLKNLFEIICRQNQRSDKQVKAWIAAFEGESIFTVEQLRNAVMNEKLWESIQTVKYVVKQLIKDYVQLNDPSVILNQPNNIYQDSDATLFGDLHRIRRYFHHKTKTIDHITYLNRRAVDLAIVEIRKTYDDDGNVLNNIHSYLRTFCLQNRTVDAKTDQKRRREWLEEKTKLTQVTEQLKKDVAILEKQVMGKRKQVDVYAAELTNREKDKQRALAEAEKLTTEAATLDRNKKPSDWIRKRYLAKEKVTEAEKHVQGAKEKLEQAQADLALATEPIRRQTNTIAENEEKIQNFSIFLQINAEESQKKLKVKYGRGLLLYGPPGTGKSELLKRAAIFAGITMTTTALAAGELNRPYVGETERLLVDIMYRSHDILYLICAMTIDEIDGLVPKRTNNAQQSKVDGISVLLSHIEGVKNIPNLIVLGATNRRNMMDEAFLRRMQAKCFVGRPSPQIRKKMLEPLLYLNADVFTNQRLNFLVKITTNFSGAAVSALKSSIIVAMDTYQDSGLTDKIFLDLAHNAAREFSCWFGIGTLPEICSLYPNIFSSKNQQEKYSLKLPNSSPTGRILVDLLDRKCLTELKTEATLDEDLDVEEKSTDTLLSRFINGCSSRNIDTIQIIDLNFLIKNNAFEENQIFELLTTIFEECDEYNRSMLIFDIDSLIMLSVSDSAMSKSLSISNIHLYQFIREKCKKAVVEENSANEFRKEKWIVMIVKHPLLRSLLVEDIEFKKTLRQTQQEYEDEQKRLDDETVKLCPKCHQSYIPAEVKHGSCHYHDGYIVNIDEPEKILNEDEAQQRIQSARLLAVTMANDDPTKRPQMPKLIWACCWAVYGNDQPCKDDICGLPKELQGQQFDPNRDLKTIVQEHFKKNEDIRKKLKQFVELYQKSLEEVKPDEERTTNSPRSSTTTTSTYIRRS